MSNTHNLLVNGKRCTVSVDYDDTPLLYVLRNDLGLKGTRFGCGTGDCGSCTVLVDGRAERSCQLPVWSLEEKRITTIEGLGTPEKPHPLQRAFVDFEAGQCGYCLSGIVMTAAELVNSPEPSREKIVEALEKNLCRCGAHGRIMRAIESAWKEIRARGPS